MYLTRETAGAAMPDKQPETEPLAELDAQAAAFRSRVHAAGKALAKDRLFSVREVAAALEFANVPADAADRTVALLAFLASLPQ